MSKDRTYKILLALVVFLAFFLRIFGVTSIPPSLSWDEVSIGYNAYSILKTGHDEHGKFLPLDTFVSYGDYKPPLAIYATVPFVGIFRLNELAVRLPSVIAGTLTVLVIFFLAQELFFSYHLSPASPAGGLITSLLLAISPWHINLSRAGFEANIATFFVVLGVWLVLAARSRSKLWVVAWLPFVLSIYTFNSARYFSPLLALGLIFFCWRQIRQNWKKFIVGSLLSLVLLLPIIPHLLSKEARLRFEEVNIFTDASIVQTSNEHIAFDGNTFLSKLLHNRRVGYARAYLGHFSDAFQLWYLFIKGDGNPKFSTQDVGQLYLLDLPFLLLGLLFIFSKQSGVGRFLLFWLVVAVIPAATARETPHALRTENGLPVFIFFIAAGIYSVIYIQKNQWKRNVLIGIIAILYFASVAYYLHSYYIHYPRAYSREWQYGYKEAIVFAESHKKEYSKIVITESIGRAYMYTLFYTRYDPLKFQSERDDYFDAAGFYHVNSFDKYRFVTGGVKEWEKNTLYILSPNETPAGGNVLYTVNQLDGNPTLVVVTI